MKWPRFSLWACAGVLVAWIIVWLLPLPAHCNADDLTGCHTLGSILLALLYGLPILMLVLLSFLLPGIFASIGRRLRSGKRPRQG